MDKTTFYRWFRQTASNLRVPEVRLQFMTPMQARGELGKYEPGSNTIYIDESQLASDRAATHTALHELAHAIVYRNNSEYLSRQNGKVVFDLNNPIASNAIKRLQYHGGHNTEWKKVASGLGVNVREYVDKERDMSPRGQLRFGLFGR